MLEDDEFGQLTSKVVQENEGKWANECWQQNHKVVDEVVGARSSEQESRLDDEEHAYETDQSNQ